MTRPGESKGFPEGKAENLVMNSFRKFMNKASDSQASNGASGSDSDSERVRMSLSTWNGAATEKYRWTQTISDLTVEIALPHDIESKKDMLVDLRSGGLLLSLKGTTIVEGLFPDKIDVANSTWMVEDSNRVTISLEKMKEGWWKSVLAGDPEIDPTKVESTKRIEDYDPETQGAIRKIMFDENQKRQGLFTSDQLSMAEKLKSAWDVDGSPFKGTAFDENVVRTSSVYYRGARSFKNILGMLINESTVVEGDKCLLVPYTSDLVEQYHGWFVRYPELLQQTGSDFLTLEEEHANQQSWREDENKLTFLIRDKSMSSFPLCGDINCFLSDYFAEDWTDITDSAPKSDGKVAEINLMIAEKTSRRKGIAEEALRIFSDYLTCNVKNVNALIAKIQIDNMPSINLFRKAGYIEFKRVECFNEVHYCKFIV